MNKIAAFFLAALALAGCQQGSEAPPLAGATMGGPFTLTDQDGRRIGERDFAGKYHIVYFGFTFCPDICPTDMQVLGQAMRRFEKIDAVRAAKVVPIFVSVDPARDTPPKVKEFVGNFHPRFVGLTGTLPELEAMAKAYGAAFQRDEKTGMVDHSRTATLYGPDGKPIALLPQDKGADAVTAELDRWVE